MEDLDDLTSMLDNLGGGLPPLGGSSGGSGALPPLGGGFGDLPPMGGGPADLPPLGGMSGGLPPLGDSSLPPLGGGGMSSLPPLDGGSLPPLGGSGAGMSGGLPPLGGGMSGGLPPLGSGGDLPPLGGDLSGGLPPLSGGPRAASPAQPAASLPDLPAMGAPAPLPGLPGLAAPAPLPGLDAPSGLPPLGGSSPVATAKPVARSKPMVARAKPAIVASNNTASVPAAASTTSPAALPGLPAPGGLPGLPDLGMSAPVSGVGLPTLPGLPTPGGLPSLDMGIGALDLNLGAPPPMGALPTLEVINPVRPATSFTSSTAARTAEDDFEAELPEPVRPYIKHRPLNPAEPKITITVSSPDGQQKVAVDCTSDWTVKELKDFVCDEKLDLWQSEFVELSAQAAEGLDHWLDLEKTLAQEGIQKTGHVLTLKVKWMKTPRKLVDDKVIHLYYLYAQQRVINGDWPCTRRLSLQLAALQAQITLGDYSPVKHPVGCLNDKIDLYFPAAIHSKEESSNLQRLLFVRHKNHGGMSGALAEREYLTLCRNLPAFGSEIFDVKTEDGQPSKLAVAEDGFGVLEGTKYRFVTFDSLRQWGPMEGGLTFTSMSRAGKKEVFKFLLGKYQVFAVLDLISGYYLFEKARHRDNIPDVQLPIQPKIPDPRLFEPAAKDVMRSGITREWSRLDAFKNAYLSACKDNDLKPAARVLRNVNRAIDDEVVLKKIDAHECELDATGLKALVHAMIESHSYKSTADESFDENLHFDTLDISNNLIALEGIPSLKELVHSDVPVKHLIMRRVGLGLKGAKELAPVLETNKCLVTIDMTGNGLKDAGLSVILKALKTNPNTHRYVMADNDLSDRSCLILGVMVQKNPVVTDLCIGQNSFRDSGMTQLLNGMKMTKRLRSLEVNDVGMGSSLSKALLTWLLAQTQLRILKIGSNSLGSPGSSALAKLLSSPNGLVVLDVESADVNAKALKAVFESLTSNKTMRELRIGGNKLDSKALPAFLNYLKTNQAVRKLAIGGMGLAKDTLSQTLEILANKSNLLSVDLSDTDMKTSARGLQNLIEKNSGMLELQLSKCNLTSAICTAICNGMEKNTTLRRLELDSNPMKTSLGTLSSLSKHRRLESLSLRATKIGCKELLPLCEALNSSRSLLVLDASDNKCEKELRKFQTEFSNLNFHVRFVSLDGAKKKK
eukprot:CAMPEP_0177660222 /NCGR_PEP_ID=MMETSP0447-20121125/17906_1 /TAXON_ID=0 /ORGANISM="Stygamoeba regulata, Strain BSH-02190019" /LENGTH=1182 /DNA_ID=CAMNT_0019165235 /DNA_START=274 /DNA_END=3822 /DNA_ORIENTATION=+